MPANEIIGLDVGQVRTGLARASSVAKLAEPLTSVPTTELIDKLAAITAQSDASTVVVGLPRNLQSQDTNQTKWLRSFIKSAKTKLPDVNFYWQDEALTSLKAKSRKLKAKSRHDEHAHAAAIILQDFLDSPVELRVAA